MHRHIEHLAWWKVLSRVSTVGAIFFAALEILLGQQRTEELRVIESAEQQVNQMSPASKYAVWVGMLNDKLPENMDDALSLMQLRYEAEHPQF